MELQEIRKNLDQLDKEMLSILAKRMNLIPKVAEFKRQNNIPRYQPEREKAVLESKRKLAEEMSLNPDLVEDIYKRIIQDAHRIEKDIMGE
jgi:chorismate mutase / prephenate dehydrogenase